MLTCEMPTPQIIRICEVLIVVRRLLLGRLTFVLRRRAYHTLM